MPQKEKMSIRERVGDAFDKTKEAIHEATEHEYTKAALDWSKKAGAELTQQAEEMGRDLMSTNVGRSAARGAAVGAIAAVPIPFVGPIAGAVLGAGVGAILSVKFGSGDAPSAASVQSPPKETPSDVIESLKKLEDLRQAGVLMDMEFQEQKEKLLKRI